MENLKKDLKQFEARLFEGGDYVPNQKIWNIVLTGGPGGGKTTAIPYVYQRLQSLGYFVLVVPEASTNLILSGFKPGNGVSFFDFQKLVTTMQLFNEWFYTSLSKLAQADKIVILHDRGLMDNKSYVSADEFNQILKIFSKNEFQVREHYDAIFHLVTAADGAEEFYTLENNAARSETIEEARNLDKKNIENWTGAPNFRIIDNSTNFEGKLDRLMNEILSVLGEPIPAEFQRKYLVEIPDLEELEKLYHVEIVDMEQFYLPPLNQTKRYIRKRSQNGNSTYYYIEKKYCGRGGFALKLQNFISEDEYWKMLDTRDINLYPVLKKRVYFVSNNQYFELDLFGGSRKNALLEIRTSTQNTQICIPDGIQVIEDVTDNPSYRNCSIAMNSYSI